MAKSLDVTNHIVLFAFGHNEFYRQAEFLIDSITLFSENNIQIHVFSDSKGWFPKHINNKVIYCQLSYKEIKSYLGSYSFIHRVKIMLIKKVCSSIIGNVIYIDCDCFIKKDISILFDKIDNGALIMHQKEDKLDLLSKHSTLYQPIFNYLARLGVLNKFTQGYHMWNAGVIGGTSTRLLAICDEVLLITDKLVS